jgi:hypothetical protein
MVSCFAHVKATLSGIVKAADHGSNHSIGMFPCHYLGQLWVESGHFTLDPSGGEAVRLERMVRLLSIQLL